jgi:hypothetical protein
MVSSIVMGFKIVECFVAKGCSTNLKFGMKCHIGFAALSSAGRTMANSEVG